MSVKSGVKTTEFWVNIAVLIGGLFQTVPLPPWAYIVLPSIYTMARGLAKAGILKGTGGKVLNALDEGKGVK